MKTSSKKRFRCFAVLLVAAILLCAVFEQLECSFKAKNFPTNQPDTVWSSSDGLLTLSVSDQATYEATVLWNGTQYSASFGFESAGYLPLIRDGRAPHHVALCLQDSEGIIIETVFCKYYMPNKHTLKLFPMDQQAGSFPTDMLTLTRIDPE